MNTYSHLFPQSHAETAAALDRHYAALITPQPHLRAV